jgi:hypothetical protein
MITSKQKQYLFFTFIRSLTMTDYLNNEVMVEDNNLRFSLKGMILMRLPELIHGEFYTPDYLFGSNQWHVLTEDEQDQLYRRIEELVHSEELPFDQEILAINDTMLCLYTRNDEEEPTSVH